MSNVVSVVIPENLRQKAWDLRINMSDICRKAIAAEVEKVEKEKEVTGTRRAIPVAGNTIPKEGDQIVSTRH